MVRPDCIRDHCRHSDEGAFIVLNFEFCELLSCLVLKAHSTHCGHSNGMISKSIRQISKLASRMADHEQLFNQFCWDILIKMKLGSKVGDVVCWEVAIPPQENSFVETDGN